MCESTPFLQLSYEASYASVPNIQIFDNVKHRPNIGIGHQLDTS